MVQTNSYPSLRHTSGQALSLVASNMSSPSAHSVGKPLTGTIESDLTSSGAHNGSYIISFTFQVRHDAIEELCATFDTHTNATMATIFQNSNNVHPNRPISYAGPTFWNRWAPIDWDELSPDVNRFLDAVVLPWLEKFADAKNVRDSLAADDGWAISHWPWEIVAAFDILTKKDNELIVYLSEQQMKSRKWDPLRATKPNSFVASILARLSAKSAESR